MRRDEAVCVGKVWWKKVKKKKIISENKTLHTFIRHMKTDFKDVRQSERKTPDMQVNVLL